MIIVADQEQGWRAAAPCDVPQDPRAVRQGEGGGRPVQGGRHGLRERQGLGQRHQVSTALSRLRNFIHKKICLLKNLKKISYLIYLET